MVTMQVAYKDGIKAVNLYPMPKQLHLRAFSTIYQMVSIIDGDNLGRRQAGGGGNCCAGSQNPNLKHNE